MYFFPREGRREKGESVTREDEKIPEALRSERIRPWWAGDERKR
jgi:hypothetical protein